MPNSCIASFSAKHRSPKIPGSKYLEVILDWAVKVVSLMAAQALNSSLFVWLCNEVENEHQNLLRMEVNELSWEEVLIHFFELPFQQTHFLQ